MEFSCIAILHIVYVIPEASVGLRRCGMCIRYHWVCIHMSATLSVTCCLQWHLLSPSEGDWWYSWITWPPFPCELHCAWLFVPFIKCTESSRCVSKGVWAQEAAGKSRNSRTCACELNIDTTTPCPVKTRQSIEWNMATLEFLKIL